MSGLIVPLGEWTLRTACRQAKAWMAAGLSLRFAVNVSAMQLRQPDFAALVERILADSGLGASALELEVTESVLLDPSMVVIAKALNEVGELGVALAIDNFGTGCSSLGYLKRFPFNRIKIDASFVRDIGAEAEGDSQGIVKAIITLGHNLGKFITAEGVETQAQLAFLRASACDEAQGSLLARPRAVGEIEQALNRRMAGPVDLTLATIDEPGTQLGETGAAETTVIHDVMELARTNSAFSRMVMQLRDAGKSWREVKDAIQAKMTRDADG